MKQSCPYCKSNNYKEQYKTFDIFSNNYEIAKCNDCNAYFLTPNPTSELLAQAYDETYYGGSKDEEKFEGFIEKGLNYFRKKRAKRIAEYANKKGKVLDIGCGNGQFLEQVSSFRDIEIFGTEMQGISVQRASKVKYINLKIGELSSSDYQENTFNVITLFHVFEHLIHPKDYLDIIDNIIKEDGYLIVSFPNIDSWQAKFFKGKWLHLDPPRHLHFFIPTDFKKILKYRGYELIEENYFSIEQNPYGAIQSWFNLFHKKRELLFEYLKGNEEYTKGTNSMILKIERLLFVVLTPLFIIVDAVASVFKKGATVEFVFRKK